MRLMYSLFDTIAEEFSAPYLANNAKHAFRLVEKSIKLFPDQIKVFEVGTFDEKTGNVEGYTFILDLKKQQDEYMSDDPGGLNA